MDDDALMYVGQKAFIEKEGRVLIVHDPDLGIDIPGGRIQMDEAHAGDPASLAQALRREVREETGLEITVGKPFTVWYYNYPEGHRNYPKTVYMVGFRCAYVSGEVRLSSEHDRFQWVEKATYTDLKHDGHFAALQAYFAA